MAAGTVWSPGAGRPSYACHEKRNPDVDYDNTDPKRITPYTKNGKEYAALADLAGLNDFERKKKQADYLLQNNRHLMALREYEDLNRELPDTENALRPAIYHNMGYAYAGLFMFDIAAKYYKRAYEMSKDEESGVQYLSSLRSYLSEEEYIRFIAEHSEYHELSLELEKKITAAKGEFEASRENRMLSALKIYKEEGNVASYYEEIDKIIYRLKEDYLQLVEE